MGGRDLVVQGGIPNQWRQAKLLRLVKSIWDFFCNLAGGDGKVVEPIEVDSTGIYDLQTNQTTFFKEQVLSDQR